MGKCSLSDLVRADRAGRRPVYCQWVPAKIPRPVGPSEGVSGAFDLGEGRQELGADGRRGVVAELRPVFPPCPRWRLGECIAHRRQRLGGLVKGVIDPVDPDPQRDCHDTAQGEPQPQGMARSVIRIRLLMVRRDLAAGTGKRRRGFLRALPLVAVDDQEWDTEVVSGNGRAKSIPGGSPRRGGRPGLLF